VKVTDSANKYARALFQASSTAGNRQATLKSLMSFLETISTHGEMARFLAHPSIAPRDKIGLLQDLGPDVLNSTALLFCAHLIRTRRYRLLQGSVAAFEHLVLTEMGLCPVFIWSPCPVPDHHIETLRHRLRNRFNLEPLITTLHDHTLLGGIRLTVGDLEIDGSVSRLLCHLSRHLTKSHHLVFDHEMEES